MGPLCHTRRLQLTSASKHYCVITHCGLDLLTAEAWKSKGEIPSGEQPPISESVSPTETQEPQHLGNLDSRCATVHPLEEIPLEVSTRSAKLQRYSLL
jgi:hypothetical protein